MCVGRGTARADAASWSCQTASTRAWTSGSAIIASGAVSRLNERRNAAQHDGVEAQRRRQPVAEHAADERGRIVRVAVGILTGEQLGRDPPRCAVLLDRGAVPRQDLGAKRIVIGHGQQARVVGMSVERVGGEPRAQNAVAHPRP